jgi:hypothetical protein
MNRVSIGMQLNVDIEKYEQMGRIMDQLERKLKKSLEKEGVRARFDFTSFNTNPCKAIEMDRHWSNGGGEDFPERGIGGSMQQENATPRHMRVEGE